MTTNLQTKRAWAKQRKEQADAIRKIRAAFQTKGYLLEYANCPKDPDCPFCEQAGVMSKKSLFSAGALIVILGFMVIAFPLGCRRVDTSISTAQMAHGEK